jgi:hypothetical protein
MNLYHIGLPLYQPFVFWCLKGQNISKDKYIMFLNYLNPDASSVFSETGMPYEEHVCQEAFGWPVTFRASPRNSRELRCLIIAVVTVWSIWSWEKHSPDCN